MLWLRFYHKPAASAVSCVNRLQVIGFALHVYAIDHNGSYLTDVAVENRLKLDAITRIGPALYFQTFSNEIGTTKALVCPLDTRSPATNWDALTREHISYFLSLSATPQIPNAILAGDRNLQINGRPVSSGILTLATNSPISWTREMHSRDYDIPCGNLLFADGSVETVKARVVSGTWSARRYGRDGSVKLIQEDLKKVIQNQSLPTNVLSIP